MQPRVPAWGNKTLKPLTENTCGGCGGSRRNSQPHRRVRWRDPQGPRTYTNPPTWESAPEGPNLLVGSTGSDWKQVPRAKQVALFPLGPLPHIQCRNTAKGVTLPRWILKVLPLTTQQVCRDKEIWPKEITDQNSRKRTKRWGHRQSIWCRVQNTGNQDAHRNDWAWLQNEGRNKHPRRTESETRI